MNRGIATADPPLEIAPFDHALHTAPLALFDRLRAGNPPLLLDLRSDRPRLQLRGTVAWPHATWPHATWPFGAVEAVLVDDDGVHATIAARKLREAGRHGVRALYGGLRLLDFTLHPSLVRGDRYRTSR